MPTKDRRLMLTVSDEIESDAADVKKDLFYDKPYSEMYRHLIRMGLDALKEEKAEKESKHEQSA